MWPRSDVQPKPALRPGSGTRSGGKACWLGQLCSQGVGPRSGSSMRLSGDQHEARSGMRPGGQTYSPGQVCSLGQACGPGQASSLGQLCGQGQARSRVRHEAWGLTCSSGQACSWVRHVLQVKHAVRVQHAAWVNSAARVWHVPQVKHAVQVRYASQFRHAAQVSSVVRVSSVARAPSLPRAIVKGSVSSKWSAISFSPFPAVSKWKVRVSQQALSQPLDGKMSVPVAIFNIFQGWESLK